VHAHDDVGLLLYRPGHTAAIPIAVIGSNDIASLPPIAIEAFATAPVRDLHLAHPPRQEVVG
jgi:hypothetical protein